MSSAASSQSAEDTQGGAPSPPDWRSTLIQQFNDSLSSLNAQIANTTISDPLWQPLHDQRQQYWNAVSALQGSIINGLLAGTANATATLSAAANAAAQAAAKIQSIADAVGLAASLLVLATAIATAAATGNPSGIIPAAQGVVNAAGKIH